MWTLERIQKLKDWLETGIVDHKDNSDFNEGIEYAYRCTLRKIDELEKENSND